MCCVFLFECTTGDRDNPFDPVNISGVGTGDYTNNNTTTPFIAPPRITGHPKNEVVTEGNTAIFSVVATGSDLYYQWKRNGVNVGSNSKSYSYTATMSRDGDTIWCVVSNSAGSETSNVATLTVNSVESPPLITRQPNDTSVFEGEKASFSVTATGDNLTYQWQLNEHDISGTAAKSKNYKTPVLVEDDDGNEYRCIISNNAGSDTSSVAEVTVEFGGLFEIRAVIVTIDNISEIFILEMNGDEGTCLPGIVNNETGEYIIGDEKIDIELYNTGTRYMYITTSSTIQYEFLFRKNSSGYWEFYSVCDPLDCYRATEVTM